MNRAIYILSLLVWMASWPSGQVVAEVHKVTVREMAFSPNDLTIKPGDSVVWEYQPDVSCGQYGCESAPSHTVTAGDFSWSSGAPSDNFTFARSFNDPGEIPYHCEVHSEPGKDIDRFMNGRITVAAEGSAFQINAGLNDAWFFEPTAGQGFFFTVFPDIPLFFLSWFTFDIERPDGTIEAILGEPGHRWLTAFGTWEGNTVTLTIELTTGGVFDSEEPPIDPQVEYGTITIVFHDCDNATLMYEIPSLGLMGTIELTRVAKDNVALCEALNAQ